MDGISLVNVNERLLGLALDQQPSLHHPHHHTGTDLEVVSAAAICSSLLQTQRYNDDQGHMVEPGMDQDFAEVSAVLLTPVSFATKDHSHHHDQDHHPISYFPPQPNTITTDQSQTTIPHSPPSSFSSVVSSRHRPSSKHGQQKQQNQSQPHPSQLHEHEHERQQQQQQLLCHTKMISAGPTHFPSAYPVVRAHESRDRVRHPPPNASDISEVVLPLEAFAEGEVLEIEMAGDEDEDDRWGVHEHLSYPYGTSAHMRQSRARCSSSTLFDEASRPPSEQSCYHTKNSSSESEGVHGNFALVTPQGQQQEQVEKQLSSKQHRNTYDSPPSSRKTAIVFVDHQHPQQPYKTHHSQDYSGRAAHKKGQSDTLGSHPSQNTSGSASTNSCADSPSWTISGARLTIEPSTPVRPANSRGNNSDSGSSNNDLVNKNGTKGGSDNHDQGSSNHSAKGSSPLLAPSTPLTPIPGELDKPTKNLMIFNKIPRQWPASQETLHHHFVAKGTKATVIKEFDPVTAERIDRVINKEKPLGRAAKEKLAAEQKEAELEARGFFEPARRWKGRDVYPRPPNWVYCRRTKNNWLEKTKILADSYKLFKSQVLGKGHHADVYKGVDLVTGQDLAIKVIYKTVTRRLGFVNEDSTQEVKNRRLLNEAWFIDYLKDGPGICKMIRVVETATKFYFVMELAQSDLNSYSNGINMREEEIRHILKPIFECLKYAHSHDITHRDIKPENILLRTRKDWLRPNEQTAGSGCSKSEGKRASLHLTGTSSSRRNRNHKTRSLRPVDDDSSILSSTFANESSYMDMDTNDGRSSMDSATLYNFDHRFDAFLADWGLAVEHDCNSGRKPVGTPLYAAPEVVRKMKRIRRREWINYRACDIWSLGVTMFVVASGIYPYHTHDALEAQSPPNWAALESSGMSREYIAFTQRLMNLTAELRPSAAEACSDPWLQ